MYGEQVIRAALFGGDGSGVMGGQEGPPTSDSWLEDERGEEEARRLPSADGWSVEAQA